MEELLDELIEGIKTHPIYLRFKENEVLLKQEEELLLDYRRVLDEYQDLKQYEKYVDMSEVKTKLKKVQDKMNQSTIIQEYYLSYHALNNMLDELTKVIFGDLSSELFISPYRLK